MGDLVIYLILGIIFGIFLFGFSFVLRHRKNLIENIPTSKVRSLAMGLVEVEGKAASYRLVWDTPFSLKHAVYYKFEVREKHGKEWKTILERETTDCFYVEDDTGKVLVNPVGADFELDTDHKYSMNIFGGENEKAFKEGLTRLGIPTQGGIFNITKQMDC